MQGEGRSLDISMSSCAKIKVGLQTTNKIAQEVLRMDGNSLAHTKWRDASIILFLRRNIGGKSFIRISERTWARHLAHYAEEKG